MKLEHAICGLCFMVLVGCAGPAEQPAEQPAEPAGEKTVASWEQVLPGLMNETQKAQQELILTATNALASELMGELSAALDQDGPAGGITVCREKAPEVAADVSGMYGVKIGRTSHRLRNPANVAPAWAEPFVSDLEEDPVYLAGPDGELGALLPIRLKAECQMCHGPAETIDDEVMAAIKDVYPEDRAVGFIEGDLRGWFWVEVPPGDTDV
jgi:hypothetical protein